MPLPTIHQRKTLETDKSVKEKLTTKNVTRDKSNTRESTKTSQKSHASGSINTQHKSDVDKSLYADAQDKGSDDPYVYELKDFAGVTIILRAAPNQKGYGNVDGHGRGNLGGSRKKSELQQSQSNIQEKFEHGDKIDHSGTSSMTSMTKSDVSSHETSGNGN